MHEECDQKVVNQACTCRRIRVPGVVKVLHILGLLCTILLDPVKEAGKDVDAQHSSEE